MRTNQDIAKIRLVLPAAMAFIFMFSIPVVGADRHIYLDASAKDGGSGAQDSPYNEFSDLNWTTITDWVNSGDSVFINLKRGEVWREKLTVGASGVPGRPVTIQAYGTGDKPIINGSHNYTAPSYRWTQSSTSNEYYLESSVGTNPGIDEPSSLWVDAIAYQRGILGSLTKNQWAWGDNDFLGYSTIYLFATSNPVVLGVKIEGSQIPQCVDISNKDYIILRDLELRQNGQKSQGSYVY
ncbi:MAG: hypothetical protein ACFFCW_25015, partial [Candidatus Hodarchaeota archaeon]